ncbi:hypothetical protein [uncultured Brevundimonas sp.]|uniref:hypothetical protein n=1 Tax=uncultured Brevundimonas sp. TaxID=213418 RepID=UPI002594E0C4|nr:hypothetical protein [uncultured Brevundimonas sp.]
MSAFEFTFGLVSLLLGLGFAHLANSFALLVMAGPRVRWDWLSPLAALAVFQSGLIFWWYQWSIRDQEVTLAALAVRAVACLAIYVVSVAALPAPEGESTDLRERFESGRRLFFGGFAFFVLLVGVVTPIVHRLMTPGSDWRPPWQNIITVALCVACVFVGRRWLHGLVLLVLIIPLALQWLPLSIAG